MCCYQFPDLSHSTGNFHRRLINTHCNGESNACISVFWLWTQRRMCLGQKGGSIHVLYNCGISVKKNSLLTSSQPKKGPQNHPEVPTTQVPIWSRPGRPPATNASNYTHLRAITRIWCHLTTRTVLIEWQTILTRVVFVSTDRASYAEMSLNSQRRNKLLHSIWVNRSPYGSPGENGPPWLCQNPSATPVSISCWHFW